MSESNLLSWTSSQPIWIQIVIGLFVFFVVFPLVVFAASELLSGVGTFLTSLSRGSEPQPARASNEPGKPSDEMLFKAICHIYAERKTASQVRDHLSDKTSTEKSALKKNPQVLRAIEEMSIENQSSEQPQR